MENTLLRELRATPGAVHATRQDRVPVRGHGNRADLQQRPAPHDGRRSLDARAALAVGLAALDAPDARLIDRVADPEGRQAAGVEARPGALPLGGRVER